MGPFEQAWRLLKMPIVPNSIQQDGNTYSASFKDPVSGEKLPMRAEYKESDYDPQRDELHTQIGEGENRGTDNPNVGSEMPARSHVGFKTAWGDEEEIETLEDSLSADEDLPMMGRQLTTEEPYRRRGYATALYDLAALAAKDKNRRILPSFDLTEEGEKFWGDKTEWPVQTGEPMNLAWRLLKMPLLLKGRSILIGDTFHPVNQPTLFGQTMLERARDIQTESENTQPTKRNTGLNYYVTVPRNDLGSNLLSRRYAIRRGDTDEIIGSLPMSPVYSNPREQMRFLREPTGDFKPTRSNIDREHRGQNLYARALMGILSAGDAGAPIVSTERNEMSEGSHRNLMDMYSRAGGNVESLSGYEPAEESDGIRYNQIFNDGYGSLRTNDPGGLPVRVIDTPSSVQYPKYKQTNLEDFGMEDERFYLPFN